MAVMSWSEGDQRMPGQSSYGEEEERGIDEELEEAASPQASYSKGDEEKVKEEMDKPKEDKK
jgi:hypothetical protein